jgi:hypothetical protein
LKKIYLEANQRDKKKAAVKGLDRKIGGEGGSASGTAGSSPGWRPVRNDKGFFLKLNI